MSQGSLSHNQTHEPHAAGTCHIPLVPARRLGKPVVVAGVDDSDLISRPSDYEFVETSGTLLPAFSAQLRVRIAQHRPVLFVIDLSTVTDSVVDCLLSDFSSHLFFRIILVGRECDSVGRRLECLTLPLRNPCLPISIAFLPKEARQLDWQIASFFEQSELMAAYCRQLLRINSLNNRENRIANYCAQGFRNREISKLLSVSEKTVEKARSDIYKKLGIVSGQELASLITFRNFFRWPVGVSFPSR